MVVVRESPRAQLSPDKNTTQWPPKSPFQALLSSPSGRRKWKEYKERPASRSPSPSPMKKTVRDAAALQAMSVASSSEDGEEDEETLQLRLAEIQAKLKLKRLQKQNKTATPVEESQNGGHMPSSRNRSRSPPKRAEQYVARSPERNVKAGGQSTNPRRLAPSAMESGIEVPLSPARDRIELREQMSPARKRLGLSAAARAGDVSLKRARDGTQLSRNDSSRAGRHDAEPPKPKISFSERLKQSKTESNDREVKQERIEKTRSTGFGSSAATSTTASRAATVRERPRPKIEVSTKRPQSAHTAQVSSGPQNDPAIARSNSTKSSRFDQSSRPRETNGQSVSRSQSRAEPRSADEEDSKEGSPGFDPFSQLHLRKRNIPHVDMARALEGKEIYTLPRLLKEVKAPHYDPPDCESDFVVFAVLASKSSPFDQKAGHRTNDENKPQEDAEKPRNKFMVFHLTDLKWEVDLFLFGSGFDQFWKLTPGTLIAILNPGVMPPKGNQNTGRFSLKLGSSEDCVMEVGVARDLGYCSSVKKDGNQCDAWVDKRSTEICEFHLNLMIDRERKHRMEVNTMFRGRSEGQRHKFNSRGGAEGSFDKYMEKDKKGANARYSREYGQLYSVRGGNAANLLDAEDKVALDQESSRKRIAAAQHERDLARKLGAMGDSIGSEYMRAKEDGGTQGSKPRRGGDTSGQTPYFDKPSASSLGLLGKKASDQHLSPAKDRKRHFGMGAVSSAGTDAMGWGGARKSGLLQPTQNHVGSPEKGQTKLGDAGRPGIVRNRSEEGSLSPKKRARFALKDKGIREPGRESLGEELKRLGDVGEDDDEELDIV